MEAKVAIFFFFFFFFAFSLQAMSFPITEKSDDNEEKKQSILTELEKVVGRPNLAVGDHGEWTVKAVQFILEKMNWKYNFGGGQKRDPKEVEAATRRIITAVGWILSDRQLNPYRSFTDWLESFAYLFNYLRDLEKGKLPGGFKNPVYVCYRRFWPTCEVRAPATLIGAVVYRFECGWEFTEQCLKNQIIDARKYQPDLQERAVRPSKPGGSYNRGCNKIFLCRQGK